VSQTTFTNTVTLTDAAWFNDVDAVAYPPSLSGTALVIAIGTFTPTITGTANVASSTPRLSTYLRVGTRVIVSGEMDITATGSGATTWGVSLPVASNFSTSYQCGGSGATDAATSKGVVIDADATNKRATFSFLAASGATHTITFTFMYQIV
jgi:hypothetical protein